MPAPALCLLLAACAPSRPPPSATVAAISSSARAGAVRGVESCAPGARDLAGQRFNRALNDVRAARTGAALDLFRESIALCPTREALWNIVLCEMLLGRKVDAHRDLEVYLADPAGLSERRTEVASRKLRELEAELSRLEIEVDALRASVQVDGVNIERAAWVTPGSHVVRATAPGRTPVETRVTVRAGERVSVRIPLPNEPEKSAEPAVASQRRAGAVIAGVGAGGLVVAAVLVGMAEERKARSEELCPNGTCTGTTPRDDDDYQTARGLRREAETLLSLANIPVVIGAATLGMGALVAFTATRRGPFRSGPVEVAPAAVLFSVHGQPVSFLGVVGKW